MNTTKRLLALMGFAAILPLLHAQNIVMDGSGGSGDIFFLYESAADTWHTVFRAKGTAGEPSTTSASGLTSPFAGFTGALGTEITATPGNTGDYNFSSLTVNVNTSTTVTIGPTPFFITHNGQFQNPGAPDLGMRIRLREDQDEMDIGSGTAVDQFDNFTFSLNNALSTFNGTPLQDTSAHVAFFGNDGLDNPVVLFNSDQNDLTGTFNNIWTHQHRNWGFSQHGQYAVVLDVQGVGGLYGDSDHQATINFNVIPEPSTLLLLAGGAVGLVAARKLRRRNHV